MNEIVLDGCGPVPLAHYLKALGILRLVAEQRDASARGCWRRDRFVLHTELDECQIERFFLEEYCPTPIVGPWGARSGFYPDSSERTARQALEEIEREPNQRLSAFNGALAAVRAILSELGIEGKDEGKARKREVMEACRARLPDDALSWLDACFALLEEDERYPPLLGTGGNEGSGSYMSGFAQLVSACLVRREHDASLTAALWGVAAAGATTGQAPGHFVPSSGGTNMGPGFSASPEINPWDYVLCLEGALIFAATSTRRNEASVRSRSAAFPFTVASSPAGYTTAATEKNRGEIWFPVWNQPASRSEVMALFGEGRASLAGGVARDGLEFARAVASLGVDRGTAAFWRVGLQERHGQSTLAVPLNLVPVRARGEVRLLEDIQIWLDRFRRATNRADAPAEAARACFRLESSIFDVCLRGGAARVQDVLVSLGRCERVMARSSRWTTESMLPPVPPLSPQWLVDGDDGSVEFRLAAGLASVGGRYGRVGEPGSFVPIRQQLEPVSSWLSDGTLRVRWDFDAGANVAWTSGHLTNSLNAIMRRRLLLALSAQAETYPDSGRLPVNLIDVTEFIQGRVVDSRIADLLWGCILVDWPRLTRGQRRSTKTESRESPGALYGLLKLCFSGTSRSARSQRLSSTYMRSVGPVPVAPRIHRAASSGDGSGAAREAARRLRGSGMRPAVESVGLRGGVVKRTAASLLLPIGDRERGRLVSLVLRPDEASPEQTERTETMEASE